MADVVEHRKWSRLVRGRDFGPIWGASGVQGFFGEGYWFHWLLRLATGFIFFTFRGVTFVAKTTTLNANKGNMPLGSDGTRPKELMPRCIAVGFRKRWVVNAIGLSGPGFGPLISSGKWQKRKEPFMISFMSIGKTREERLQELREFAHGLTGEAFNAGWNLENSVALQWNVSCPNVGLSTDELVLELDEGLEILSDLPLPVLIKFSPLVPVSVLKRIDEHPRCDGFVIGNSIGLADVPLAIWQECFSSLESPVADAVSPRNVNAGALSATDYNRAMACQLIYRARQAGVSKHINGIGGTRHWRHVDEFYWAGASSVSLSGGVTILAPWRARSVIRRAWHLFPK